MNAVANTDTGADTEPKAPVSELSKDELFHLLQNERRRRVLRYLQGTESEINMRDIAEQVAAWENDTTIDALGSNERQRVYIALYQSHLPKLDEAGVLTYNQQRGIVRRTELADQLDAYLNIESPEPAPASPAPAPAEPEADGDSVTTDADPDRYLRYYGMATIGSLLSIGASVTDLIALPGTVVAALVTPLFLAVTVGLTAHQRDLPR